MALATTIAEVSVMRNDARPIGQDAPASPVGGRRSRGSDQRPDGRDSAARDRQPHVIHKSPDDTEPDDPNGLDDDEDSLP
jgi:hypothetical protein